jgi:dienelactone hydrolase
MRRIPVAIVVFVSIVVPPGAMTPCQAADATVLAHGIAPVWECLTGKHDAFALEATVQIGRAGGDDASRQTVRVRLERFDADSFDLIAEHPDYAATLRRRAGCTALALPRHGVVHVGVGAVAGDDHLAPVDVGARLVSGDSLAASFLPLLAQADPEALLGLATRLFGVRPDGDGGWRRGDLRLRVADDSGGVAVSGPGFMATVARVSTTRPAAADDWPALTRSELPRDELERTLARGLRRALEILAPGPALVTPDEADRDVEHGTLRWVGGHRVVTLHGTPEEIGRAHGELLATEAWRCLDSVLHVVGTVETIRDGRWFRHRLEEALVRLAPHIPARHRREMHALAVAVDCDPHVMEVVNVFPELFHCSGFAVMGSATADGTLYHGRVLDYMTRIGLQDAAATFVLAGEGVIPLVNVGYAGFTGSVSGMNERGISLGEMGGRGEGNWDGVPMATLMRRALEECTTLDEVMDLWRTSPRTCEYYYVFADGKTRRAVGVAATPEAIEFIEPGQAHARLGPGIPDAVVLSAGDRLECLRGRVTAGHGRIDEAAALRLMDRPVAMESNLHNVLFVPEHLRLHVAHASHGRPAAEEPAIVLDLAALLAAVPVEARAAAASPPRPGATFAATDSLAPPADAHDDARACLAGLVWRPEAFTVRLDPPVADRGDVTVRFPSPRPGGVTANDEVAIEWYRARDADGDAVASAPACVVVHESGSGMPFGRMIARGLAARGVHGCLVHLPYYGLRRPPGTKPGPESLVRAVPQAIADVRRARDAVAVLPGVDPARVGVQGTSLGGFVTATAAALDDGFASVFVVLAGGDIAGVLADGRRDAETLRTKLAQAGMTEAEVRGAFHAVEPLRLAHRLDPARTWLYSARYDDVVPPRHAALLADAARLAPEHHVQLHADHYTGVVYLPLVLAQMRGHILATPAGE